MEVIIKCFGETPFQGWSFNICCEDTQHCAVTNHFGTLGEWDFWGSQTLQESPCTQPRPATTVLGEGLCSSVLWIVVCMLSQTAVIVCWGITGSRGQKWPWDHLISASTLQMGPLDPTAGLWWFTCRVVQFSFPIILHPTMLLPLWFLSLFGLVILCSLFNRISIIKRPEGFWSLWRSGKTEPTLFCISLSTEKHRQSSLPLYSPFWGTQGGGERNEDKGGEQQQTGENKRRDEERGKIERNKDEEGVVREREMGKRWGRKS